MALDAETLDPLNFDNLTFYVSLAIITVRVHVIYKKKRYERLRSKWARLSFIAMGPGLRFVKKNKLPIRLIVF